uniref:LHFPL tetraspan subfamily member 2a n=1 Tax=Macrostomum lignano TaxID=282301 RepID=A0A1I8HBB0_9PLAT
RAAAAAAATAAEASANSTVKDRASAVGTARGLRCLWAGWVLMCWLSGMCAAAGFLLPYWLKGSRSGSGQTSDLGLFRLCVYPAQAPDGTIQLALDCSHYQHFMNIPSPCWRAAFVLMSTACCLLLLLTFFLAFSGFRLAVLRIRQVIGVCAAAQGLSAFCIILACLLYPAGWQWNPEVSQVCGPAAGAFSAGHCHLGWAFVLACAGGFLSALTVAFPVQMAQHYPERFPDHHSWQRQRQPQQPHQLEYQRLHHHQQPHQQFYLQAPPRQAMMGHQLLGCYPAGAAAGAGGSRYGY